MLQMAHVNLNSLHAVYQSNRKKSRNMHCCKTGWILHYISHRRMYISGLKREPIYGYRLICTAYALDFRVSWTTHFSSCLIFYFTSQKHNHTCRQNFHQLKLNIRNWCSTLTVTDPLLAKKSVRVQVLVENTNNCNWFHLT